MVTPTPRTISPQDIVRIYVPPAPPDEQKHYQNVSKPKTSPSTKDSKPNIFVSEANNLQKHSNNNNKTISSNGSVSTSPEKMSLSSSPPSQVVTPSASSMAAGTATAAAWSIKPLTGLSNESNKNSIIYGSDDLTPVHCAFNRSDDDLVKSFADASSLSTTCNSLGYIGIGGPGGGASSSSRRGSLSRKSPSAVFESNILMECPHMIKRRLSSQSNSSINFEIRDKSSPANSENIGNSSLSLRLNSNGEKRMTSFEQLARYKGSSTSDEKLNDEVDKYSPDDEENYSYSYYKYKSAESRQRKSPTAMVESSKRFVSESNVQYESISMRRQSSKEIEYQALNKRRPNSSGNETSLYQYETFSVAPTTNSTTVKSSTFNNNTSPTAITAAAITSSHKTTSVKEYKRFYGTSNEDTCDEELNESHTSSPNSKSVLNSPDTVPLLQSSSPPSYIPKLKSKSSMSPTSVYSDLGSPQSEYPNKPSRIPVMHLNERKSSNNSKMMTTTTATSPTTHASPNTSELNRILPPIEIVSSSSSSNNSLSSRILQKTPTSPNGQSIGFGIANRPMKLQSKNGTTLVDSNTIRIKVNQNDKQ